MAKDTQEQSTTQASFNPAVWAAQYLDLLHPPDYQASAVMRDLSVKELEAIYQMLRRDYSFSDWPDFVWEAFSSVLEVAMTM